MADHRWSFPPAALERLAIEAGFRVVARDPQAGGFQALLLRPARSRRLPLARASVPVGPRRACLAAWRALDATLAGRLVQGRCLVGFGVGEVARLLRAFAPATWARLEALTAEEAAGMEGLAKPFIPSGALDPARHMLLMALRPSVQAALSARFAAYPVIR